MNAWNKVRFWGGPHLVDVVGVGGSALQEHGGDPNVDEGPVRPGGNSRTPQASGAEFCKLWYRRPPPAAHGTLILTIDTFTVV